MNNLYINNSSLVQLRAIESDLPHCTILYGKEGTGLLTISLNFAKRYDKSTLLIVPDEKGNIKIDTVRQLYRQTNTKKKSFQFVVIDDADSLAHPAQNALLKLLEEPPKKTIFILTSHQPQLLLPTIRSRAQEVMILPLNQVQTEDLLDKQKIADSSIRSKLLFMANGLPAEILRLINSSEYFEARSTAIREARSFISASLYQKLIVASGIGNNREKALEHIRSVILIVQTSLKQKPSQNLADLLKQLLHCEEKLLADGNVRVQLLRFVFY